MNTILPVPLWKKESKSEECLKKKNAHLRKILLGFDIQRHVPNKVNLFLNIMLLLKKKKSICNIFLQSPDIFSDEVPLRLK